MTHDQAKELLLDLAYGELTPDVAHEVSRHATSCAECTGELARIAAVRGAAAMLDDRPPSPVSREELLLAAQRAASRRRHLTWLRRPATLSFAAAAAVVAIVAGVTLKLTREDLGGAGVGLRRVVEDAKLGAPEPSTEERREAYREPAAPPPAVARPLAPTVPEGPPPPALRPRKKDADLARPPPAIPSADAAGQFAAAPAQESAEAPARKKSQPPHAASQVAAPPAAGAALPSQRSVGGPVPDGGLVEERRQLRCGDVVVERVALVAKGGRIVKLTERRGEALAEGWYDDTGSLRPAGRREQAATVAPGLALPLIAPTLEALGTACGW